MRFYRGIASLRYAAEGESETIRIVVQYQTSITLTMALLDLGEVRYLSCQCYCSCSIKPAQSRIMGNVELFTCSVRDSRLGSTDTRNWNWRRISSVTIPNLTPQCAAPTDVALLSGIGALHEKNRMHERLPRSSGFYYLWSCSWLHVRDGCFGASCTAETQR